MSETQGLLEQAESAAFAVWREICPWAQLPELGERHGIVTIVYRDMWDEGQSAEDIERAARSMALSVKRERVGGPQGGRR